MFTAVPEENWGTQHWPGLSADAGITPVNAPSCAKEATVKTLHVEKWEELEHLRARYGHLASRKDKTVEQDLDRLIERIATLSHELGEPDVLA
jgi:hypothetical protein